MSAITIPLPPFEGRGHIEVEVKMNGQKRQFNYRVEFFRWENCPDPSEARPLCLRKMLQRYDRGWKLIEIGSPTDEFVPVMFRQNP